MVIARRDRAAAPKSPCCSRSDKRVVPGWPSGVGSLWARGDRGDHHSLTAHHPCGLTSGFMRFFLLASSSLGPEI